jgi:hypothetical protein
MPKMITKVLINPTKNKDGDSKKWSALEIEIIKDTF